MKIYFTAAISLQDQFGEYYDQIVAALQTLGHEVIHEHITGKTMDDINSIYLDEKHNEEHYKFIEKQIAECDVVVAETSFPSTLNIGHEVTLALEKEKPVLALYMQGKRSVLLYGKQSEKLLLSEYSGSDIFSVVKWGIEYLAANVIDTRFNMMMSSEMSAFLDTISRKDKIPKSVYVRNLIKKQMDLVKHAD